MKIIAVVPAYNEEKRVAEAIADATSFVDEVVVVDDCSTDDTFNIACDTKAIVLQHVVNRGQGASLQTGTEFALKNLDADIIVHFDADGQMQGKDIPVLCEPIVRGECDVVLGSRFLDKKTNMPFARRVTLKMALIFTKIISGINVSDPHCGFRALSRRAGNVIKLRQNRMAHASEILDLIKSNHLNFVSRPVEVKYTQDTLKKGMSFLDGFTVLKDYFKHKFFDTL